MNETLTLDEYILKFAEVGATIASGLDDLAVEIETPNSGNAASTVTNIMIQVAQVQALQAIAVGIKALIEKEN